MPWRAVCFAASLRSGLLRTPAVASFTRERPSVAALEFVVTDLVWLIPAFPLAGFLLILVAGRRLGEPKAGIVATLMCLGAFVTTLALFFDMLSKDSERRVGAAATKSLFDWVSVGSLHVELAFLADPLAITMALFVTGISSLIHLYSIGYMHGDPKFSKFFLYLNLFVFSMLMLVLGENMLVTFLGWEGVGTCSYLLISFWFTRDSAATAGKKAFVTNRIGDFGFMLAMFLTYSVVGSISWNALNEHAEAGLFATTTATAVALLLFLGACGKSAQLPLYVWLPDAMEGPTPVSALIHAATMVTAGVYLMVRVNPLLAEVPDVGTVIAIVGVATALFAATVAVAQNDIKKVLAYSTVSQLGYMFLAVGSGAYVAAVFHMVTHAFFKALMFLGSGSVIHGMHDEQDMRRMGALRKLMPITAITFIVGWLAIAGVPPFAGFWSKDEILLLAFEKSPVLWAVGLLTALLTAYYMTRQVIMVFFGTARWNEPRDTHASADIAPDAHAPDAHAPGIRPHESPITMWAPLVVLAGLAIVGGGLNLPFTHDLKFLEKWLEPLVHHSEVVSTQSSSGKVTLAAIAVVVGLIGIGAAVAVYARHKFRAVEPAVLANAWYVDKTYAAVVGGPGQKSFDLLTHVVDAKGVDGAVNGAGWLVQRAGGVLRKAQTGYVRNYAWGIAIGAVFLMAWFASRGAW
jgi:NADH-quinone oxidoreductase subunit L